MPSRSIWMQDVHIKKTEIFIFVSGLILSITGAIANITIRLANKGKMPVMAYNYEFAPGQEIKYISAFQNVTRLNFLADRITFGNQLLSIGDVLMYSALVIWCVSALVIEFKKYREAKRSYSELKEG